LFNKHWLYYPAKVDADVPNSEFASVTLPHTNKVLPYHNFDDQEYQFISTYRNVFTLPEPLQGRRLFVHFEGALLASTFSINGHAFPEVRGGFLPFEFDITDLLNETDDNHIQVHVDSRERTDIPPFGHTVDYMVFGGIYRDVHLRYVSPVYLKNAHVKAHNLLEGQPSVEIAVHVTNLSDAPQTVTVAATLPTVEGVSASATIEAHDTQIVTLKSDITLGDHLKLWTMDAPHLIDVTLNLTGDHADDELVIRTGLRHVVFKEEGFFLNGERVQLRGLNRHQNFPYIGAAAPERLQRKDADILKYDLGVNIARTSHYPQSHHFLDRCDEIGLLVFEEIPGWQHIGDEDWQCLAQENVRDMIQRDWNHPSIIIWGVRINESWDNREFYLETNRIAHEQDSTRQTGGVRFFLGSEFLEDVYTFNDFSNGILDPQDTPHLVTEFNGHMFPTKTFDNEERRVEHAVRHLRVQSQAYANPKVTGAIGWCAFDYNTHTEFGAGDRICYHGVMDIFRLPKFAAAFYASQQDPKQNIVLQAATNWAIGDIKEGLIEPIYVFSNCDTIEAYHGEELRGTFKPDASWHVPYPPFVVTDLGALLAHPYKNLRFVGFIDGKPVAEQIIAHDQLPRRLSLVADDLHLLADGADMTRVVIRITDDYGNVLPYSLSAVHLALEGEAELFGPNPFPLVGGQGAVYVKATHNASTVVLTAKADRLPTTHVTIVISR
jgi:beta-galactosidase